METGSERPRGAGSRRFAIRAAVAALGLLALVALGTLTARVAQVYPVSSDDATGVLEAASVLEGNVLLRGWTVSNVSFLATDLPFYVVGVAFKGLDAALMREVPSAVYAVAAGIAVVLAASRARFQGPAAAAVAVLLGLPAGGLAEFVTKGYTRVGTSIGLFLALFALSAPDGRKVSPARLVCYAAALGLTLLSDAYAIVLAVSAVATVCVLAAARGQTYENLGLGRVASATLLAVLLAQGASWLIRAVGGVETEPLPLRDYLQNSDRLRMLAANIRALAQNLPSLYRLDLPASGSVLEWTVWLGCLIGPALLAYAIWRGRPTRRVRLRGDFVNDVLWVSMALGVCAFLVSANEKDRGSMRYMVPFLLSGAVLTGRILGTTARARARVNILLGVLAAAYAVTIAWDLKKARSEDPAVALAGWLDAHRLAHGYGPYWDASIVTASGRGRVAVRPVRGRLVGPGRLVIEPFRWMSNESWYRAAPSNFVVFREDPGPKYHFLINEHNCVASFGRPSGRYDVGAYTVLVWQKDLRPSLVRGLPWTP
jgi:hypothetical protein